MDIARITEYIFLPSDPVPADLMMVFGTRYREPLKTVRQLYMERLTGTLLLSGGDNRHTGHNEAREMAMNLIDMGVAMADMVLEDRSTNTLENVLFSRQVIEEEIGFDRARRILVVVKHYHSRRALMTLRRHFPEGIEFHPVTYDIFGFDRDNWHQSEIGREKVMGEMERIKKYLAKGDIEEL